MSFDAQSAPNETRLLCARKGKKKKNFTKKNSRRMLLLADSSFAIDVQHDKRRSLQGWFPGCSTHIQQRTSLATCIGGSACRSTRNPHQTKRVCSVREKGGEKNFTKKNSLRSFIAV
jgi:hypothetical protein